MFNLHHPTKETRLTVANEQCESVHLIQDGRSKGDGAMDTYAIVTEKIVNLLEHGVVPWRRPWSATGRPRNVVSKKPYRGINVFLLSATRYVSPFWLTMKQAERAWRIGAQGRAQSNRGVLEGRSNP